MIVNWNTGTCLRDCLASIVAAAGHEGRLVGSIRVVDNASTDGSAEDLRAASIPLILIRNAVNAGFARACNQGARGHRAPYILFLNPDVLLRPGSLGAAMDALGRHAAAGFGICGIRLLYGDGRVFPSCVRFPSPRSLLGRTFGLDRVGWSLFPAPYLPPELHRGTHEVDHVTGAFFLVQAPLFDLLGGFDERFFVYYEEMDFALRARHAGGRSLFTDEGEATHLGGLSSSQVIAHRTFYTLRSRALYVYKHHRRAGGDLVLVLVLFAEPVMRAMRAIITLRWKSLVASGRATLLLWRALPQLLAARNGPRPPGGPPPAPRT